MKKRLYRWCALITMITMLFGYELPALAMESIDGTAYEESVQDETDVSLPQAEDAYPEEGQFIDDVTDAVSVTTSDGGLVPAGDVEKIPFDGSKEHYTVSFNYAEYDGTPKTPQTIIYFKKTADSEEVRLEQGTDYTVEFSDNVGPGYGSCTFTKVDTAKTADIEAGSFWYIFPIIYKIYPAKAPVTVSGNVLNIKNDHDRDLYFVAVKSGEDLPDTFLTGKETLSGNTVTMNTYYDSLGRSKTMDYKTEYDLYACIFSVIGLDEYYAKDDGVTLIGTFETGEKSSGRVDGYEDGYSKIKFSAVTQKNQNVKVSWKPDAKQYPDYKKFKLYTMDETGEFKKQIWPLSRAGSPEAPKASKSAVIKAADAAPLKGGILCLECYDKDGNLKGDVKYLTAVAPFVYYVRSGDSVNEQSFCLSELSQSDSLTLKLQAGTSKKEETFTLSSVVPTSGIDTLEYPLSKKQSVPAMRTFFNAEDSGGNLTMGTKYFFRACSVYDFMGMDVNSAPSNVLAVKAGPALCEIYEISGADPVKEREAYRKGDYDDTSYCVHYDSYSTCYKLGYVTFNMASGENLKDESKYSAIELMRSDSRQGIFKTVKKYKLSEVKKVDGTELYYVTYNNFPPEETWYYAVRAVSKEGKAPGGYEDGYQNTTEFESVLGIISVDTGEFGIGMAWLHDDCAKKYWVYRGKSDEDITNQLKDKKKPYKKLNGSSFKKISVEGKDLKVHIYEDTKDVIVGDKYYYAIRPVYNEKVSAARDYDEELEKLLYRTGELEATAEGVEIKTLKATDYSTVQINVKWPKAPAKSGNKVTAYEVQRKLKSEEDTDANWKRVLLAQSGSTEFKNRSFNDVVETGVTYNYRVRAFYNNTQSSSAWDALYNKKTPASAFTTTLKAASLSVAKQSGSGYPLGGVVKFTVDKKDMETVNQGKLTDLKFYVKTGSSTLMSGIVQPGVSTYSFTDNEYLTRGQTRYYAVEMMSNSVPSEVKTASYNKPSSISLSAGKSEIYEGDTVTINVGFSSGATVKDYDCESSDSSVLKIVSYEGGSIKVKGLRQGRATINVRAYYSGWTDGSSSGNLRKSVTITVRKKPETTNK
ncbi:MAG: hypothetical protein IJT00_09920 [Lachnospiraceae bacterium]|nr:hypothetical protein [Lachnospiraceae bacterium]